MSRWFVLGDRCATPMGSLSAILPILRTGIVVSEFFNDGALAHTCEANFCSYLEVGLTFIGADKSRKKDKTLDVAGRVIYCDAAGGNRRIVVCVASQIAEPLRNPKRCSDFVKILQSFCNPIRVCWSVLEALWVSSEPL